MLGATVSVTARPPARPKAGFSGFEVETSFAGCTICRFRSCRTIDGHRLAVDRALGDVARSKSEAVVSRRYTMRSCRDIRLVAVHDQPLALFRGSACTLGSASGIPSGNDAGYQIDRSTQT